MNWSYDHAVNIAIFEKKNTVYRLVKMPDLGWKNVLELSIPSERAHFELLNATFSFEIGPSKLEL